MATIDSKQIIDDIIAGKYDMPGEPRTIKIIEYTNAWDKRTWGVVEETDPDPDRYERVTEYVRDPKVIWENPKFK